MRLKTILCAALAVPAALVYPCSAATALAGSDAPAMRQESHVMSQAGDASGKRLDEVVESYYKSGKFEGVALVVGMGMSFSKRLMAWPTASGVSQHCNYALQHRFLSQVLHCYSDHAASARRQAKLDDNLATICLNTPLKRAKR
jgi:hypothetical protein